MSLYDDDHVYCFSCNTGKNITDPEELEEISSLTPNTSRNKRKKLNMTNKKAPSEFKKGKFTELPTRKLKEDTCKRFNVRGVTANDFSENPERVKILFPYYDDNGGIIAQKIKFEWLKHGDKDRYTTEGNSKDAILFGQQIFEGSKAPYITVCEGELDCLSIYEMNGDFPVVSIRNGAGSALKECKKSFEFLNSFKHIRICFDADKQGRKAAEEVSKLFAGKCSIVELQEDLKDPSGYLVEGQRKEFIKAWHSAKEVKIDGIVPASSLEEEVLIEDVTESVEVPFNTLQSMIYGLRKGEITVVKAPTGVGKSSFVRQVLHHVIKKSDWKIGMVSLEDSMKRVMLSFVGIELKANLHLPDVRSEISKEEIRKAFNHLFNSKRDEAGNIIERMEFCDHYANNDVTYILNKVEQLIKAFDCDIIVLDHITMLAAQAENNSDGDRKTLEDAMTKMAIKCTANNAHLMVISQENDDGKTRGTRVIEHQAFNMWRLSRDKMAKSVAARNLTELSVEKNRTIGFTGPAGGLMFDPETGNLKEISNEEVMEIKGEDSGFDNEGI
jgi:twinkle protein